MRKGTSDERAMVVAVGLAWLTKGVEAEGVGGSAVAVHVRRNGLCGGRGRVAQEVCGSSQFELFEFAHTWLRRSRPRKHSRCYQRRASSSHLKLAGCMSPNLYPPAPLQALLSRRRQWSRLPSPPPKAMLARATTPTLVISVRNSTCATISADQATGLTPVKVEGVVRTRVEEDGKPATASALTVSLRCYEARVGRVGVVKSNILVEQSQTLWTPPSGAVWGALGAVEIPFKIVLPANAAGNSTFSLQEYRVYWRIEAGMSARLVL